MDPQQYLLLQVGYRVLRGRPLQRSTLAAADVGIMLGMMNSDHA